MQTEQNSVVTYGTVAAVGPDNTVAGRVQMPSVFQCGLVITFMKLMLRIRHFQGTLDWIRRRVQNVPEGTGIDPLVVKAVERSVAIAGALYPGRAMCLEQSLTLYYLLKRQGVAVRYCQGVQPYPFQAHAWIEYQGEVVNDVQEHAKMYLPLPDQLP